ncbi:hypothetical protein KP509_01G010300 [Ceratopteris richardii]|uniref:C2H2-type domain-containing protein n=1 Tax=Ceratopteris richardii TaxID=49495 RepID=A0A8T2VAD7_CERRI|nr:hypothetical protein KP509_01G010300 [Ceratopteris richardii]
MMLDKLFSCKKPNASVDGPLRLTAEFADPDAEVIALSPKMLMESNRYVCEICNQGFHRDQNLQMHRRRHKVPWKLLKRADPEVQKRVYVCPEPSCLHHSPCHALGDLVGIKKHYRRKHSSMKQWACEKCSKAYAVQSDYKAHIKTCGTRGHCCDCGRVFSRVESFIEHQDACTAAASVRDHKDTSSSSFETSLIGQHHPTILAASNSPNVPDEFTIKDSFHLSDFNKLQFITVDQDKAHAISLIPQTVVHSTCAPLPEHGQVSSNARFCAPLTVTSGSLPSSEPPSDAAHVMVSSAMQQAEVSHHFPELQLLPTKTPPSQLESSQSSNVCIWGKDIGSTNSSTSVTVCSSPCDKSMDQKEQFSKNPSSHTLAGGILPCKLQLSIGLVHDDHPKTGSEINTPMNAPTKLAASPVVADANMAPHCRASNMVPWLNRDALGSVDPQNNHSVVSFERHNPLQMSAEEHGINVQNENDETCLELATGGNTIHEMNNYESQRKNERESLCKESSSSPTVTACNDLGSAEVAMKEQKADIEETLVSCPDFTSSVRLLRCSSLSRPMLEADQKLELPSPLSSQALVESGTPACDADQLWRPSNPIVGAEAVSPPVVASELLSVVKMSLQKANEKLRKTLAEKLEAERAWEDARKEVEQAETELAVLRRLSRDSSGYKQMQWRSALQGEKEGDVRSQPRNGSTAARGSYDVIFSSSSSLQMQLNAGGVVLTNASSFVTCPSCHCTQVLYHPANLTSAMFLPTQPAHHSTAANPISSATTITTVSHKNAALH